MVVKWTHKIIACVVLIAWIARFAAADQAAEPDPKTPCTITVFESGRDGYAIYRIPALLATRTGALLAFCEGRKNGASDTGDIDILLRRSTDRGKTWSTQQVVWDDGPNTCGNPCAVLDRQTGVVWLFSTHNLGIDAEKEIIDSASKGSRSVWVTHSDDDGVTWAQPTEITREVKKPDWTWYATGPGAGIQMIHGPHRGRLIVPCDHVEAQTKRMYSHVIYSDDHGRTWQLGGRTPQDQVNECEVAELTGGRLMLNMRNYDSAYTTRKVSLSADGGTTWSDVEPDPVLIEPVCQASLRRYGWCENDGGNILLFSNPASTTERCNLCVRLSRDEGKSWPLAKTLQAGPAAYSCLEVLADGTICCFYEAGDKNPYESIVLAQFPLSWLTEPETNQE